MSLDGSTNENGICRSFKINKRVFVNGSQGPWIYFLRGWNIWEWYAWYSESEWYRKRDLARKRDLHPSQPGIFLGSFFKFYLPFCNAVLFWRIWICEFMFNVTFLKIFPKMFVSKLVPIVAPHSCDYSVQESFGTFHVISKNPFNFF